MTWYATGPVVYFTAKTNNRSIVVVIVVIIVVIVIVAPTSAPNVVEPQKCQEEGLEDGDSLVVRGRSACYKLIILPPAL